MIHVHISGDTSEEVRAKMTGMLGVQGGGGDHAIVTIRTDDRAGVVALLTSPDAPVVPSPLGAGRADGFVSTGNTDPLPMDAALALRDYLRMNDVDAEARPVGPPL